MAKSTPKTIQTANKILRDFFKLKKGFNHDMLQDNKDGSWSLREEQLAILTTDGKDRKFIAWPINLQSYFVHDFFLSFNISLLPDESIEDLNIKLFRKSADKPELEDSVFTSTELLLRAEWSNKKASKGAAFVHAQPHWHVHPVKMFDLIGHRPIEEQRIILQLLEIEENDSILDTLQDTPIVSEKPKNKEEVPLFQFHLAMVADWCNYKKAVKERDLDERTLVIWLPQCLEYIKEQVEYIMSKMPQRVA